MSEAETKKSLGDVPVSRKQPGMCVSLPKQAEKKKSKKSYKGIQNGDLGSN